MFRYSVFLAISLSLFAHHLWAEAPFQFLQTPGKLPKEVIPARYDVYIEPSIEKSSFHGSVAIDVSVKQPVRRLVLNSLGLEITEAWLAGEPRTPLTPKVDEKEQLLSFELPKELPAGAARLEIKFAGKLSEAPEGLYITRYATETGEKRALTTQFQATDARRMFPCWDEPVFRAKFRLAVRVPAQWLTSSNMPAETTKRHDDGTATITFAESPSMVSYLLAFSGGELEALEDEVDGIKLRMITTEGKKEQARYALEVTKQVLPYFNEYFGVKYPLPKLDQVSFASTAASGMENWGTIIYNDMALLYDPKVSTQTTKEWVFGVVAHEIAHQWFGDLVTMAWWDNLWLNEGFASWMATKASDRFNADWKVWLRAAEDKEHAMQLDARGTTHPIQQKVQNEAQANDAFDVITYQKGQAFIRMLEAWLGEEKFRAGIRQYMKRHAYGNTTTADLWTALAESSGQPVTEMAAGWTEQPGFPVIRVRSLDGSRLELQAERFRVQKDPLPALNWQIPVSMGAPGQAGALASRLLEGKPLVVEKTDALLKLNVGDTGYYRVDYEAPLFRQLADTVAEWPEADRLNLLNDTWAMVVADRTTARTALELVERLRNDPSAVVRQRILGILTSIERFTRDTPVQESFRAWARSFLQPQLVQLGWEAKVSESPLEATLRAETIGLLGYIGDESVRRDAQARFARFLTDPKTLTGDLRERVLAIVGRYADDATYAKLHELAKRDPSTEQKQFLYGAMSASLNPDHARRTLALSITDELVPQAATRLVHRVGDVHPTLAWEFAKPNLEALLSKISSIKANDYVPGIFRDFIEAARADELESFARNSLPPDAAPMVARAADEIRQNALLKARLVPEIVAWCREHVAP